MPKRIAFPYFLWQEYMPDRWETLNFHEVFDLNGAASTNRKQITLKHRSSTIVVSLQKMTYKINDVEVKLRCLILNNCCEYAFWSCKDKDGNFINYPPRMTYFLEVVHQKQIKVIDFYFQNVEYQVNLSQSVITNKTNGCVLEIRRDSIEFIRPMWSPREMKMHIRNVNESKNLLKQVSDCTITRVKNLLFNQPVSGTEVTPAFSLPPSSQDTIASLQRNILTSNNTKTAVDHYYFEENSEMCHVVSKNKIPLSATLTFSSLEENVNKFIIIQVLKFYKKKKYAVWTRHGRIGFTGVCELSESFTNLDDAVKEFKEKFYDKTLNHWDDKYNFERKVQGYNYISTYFNDGRAKHPEDLFQKAVEKIQSYLYKEVQDLLLLVFSGGNLKDLAEKWLENCAVSDLGIPTAKQLLESFEALNDIVDLLKNHNKGKELVEACNTYYMKAPHNYRNEAPRVIVSAEIVEEETFILQTVSYLCLSKDYKEYNMINPIDLKFKTFNCNLFPLHHQSEEFNILVRALISSHGPTHNFRMEVLDAFRWHKESDNQRFVDIGNKVLLWHGTKLCYMEGIMKNGLRMPNLEAPCTTSMFGKAIYFADCSSKSAYYCPPAGIGRTGVLLLCEVSLGETETVYHGGDYTCISDMFGSLSAIGEYYPTSFELNQLVFDTRLPTGPLLRRDVDLDLRYNEYVLYKDNQVRVRYLLKVRFHVQ